MLLEPNSVLVSQPLLLDIEQRRFLTGIRFAAESAQLFYAELCSQLEVWNDVFSASPRGEEHLRIFASAWALIDNGRRFHRLLWKLPGLKELPCVLAFVTCWSETLKSVRDAMQHPDGDYIKEMKENYVYGSLYWIDSRTRVTDGKIFAHVVNAGPQANHQLNGMKFPKEISIDSGEGVHSLVLSTAGASIEIDGLIRDIKETLLGIEDHVQRFWENIKEGAPKNDDRRQTRLALTAQTDTFFRLELKPQDAGSGA